MNLTRLLTGLIAVFWLTPVTLFAQQTEIHRQPDAMYRQALELFGMEKYGAALELFDRYIDAEHREERPETMASARFHAAVCAAWLFHPDAGPRMQLFLEAHPDHAQSNDGRFYMGMLMHRNRDYESAVKWFSQYRPGRPGNERHSEYAFKYGYSLFMTGDHSRARNLLAQLNDQRSPWYTPATYYLAHMAYLDKDFAEALGLFALLENDPAFGPVIPYYKAHIYYLQQDYTSLLSSARDLLESATPRRAPEIARMIGDALFQQGQFNESLPYLEQFIRQTPGSASRDDHYQLGFAYLRSGDPAKAIRHLERATSGTDKLAQNAWYHLGWAYLETDQKRFARNAFQKAHEMGIDREIAGEALFHYALLSFELSFDPFNEAILAFQSFIRDYPDSERLAEAQSILIDLYLSTRNYRAALQSISEMDLSTPRLREAFQRIAYFRGVELFNAGAWADAISHFTLSVSRPENTQLTAMALFWKGEAHHRLSQYEEAIRVHETFLVSPGAFGLNEFSRAHYSIGYAHFKLKNYPRAITAFRKFIAESGQDARLVNDALNRIADSYFVSRNFRQALDFYERAVRNSPGGNDYAAFQKGMVQGVMGDFQDKINSLQFFLTQYPNSPRVPEARYELAGTYLITDNQSAAQQYFNQLIREHPNSGFVASARLKSGLIHFNLNENQQALRVLKEVVSTYPGTPEAQQALTAIRNIYINLDQVDEFFRFAEASGVGGDARMQQDSLTFVAAENRYMQGDCMGAAQSFTNYLERFPTGSYSLQAHFFRAECDLRNNLTDRALESYNWIISRPASRFTENALVRAARIEFGRQRYAQALEHFTRLIEIAELSENRTEALAGQLRSLNGLGYLDQAAETATTLLAMPEIPVGLRQEALLTRGLAALENNQMEEAGNDLQKAADAADNERAAKALYHLALISFRQGDYAGAEEKIFEFMHRITAYDYWLARLFLLLADTYMEIGNTFQARHTLQSIIDNYPGEDLRREARLKMDRIRQMEAGEHSLPAEAEPIEIDPLQRP